MRESSPMFRSPKTLSIKATESTSRLLPHPLSRKHIETDLWKISKENIRAMDSLSTKAMGRQSTRTPSANWVLVRYIDSATTLSSFEKNLKERWAELDDKEQRKIRLMLSRRWKTI